MNNSFSDAGDQLFELGQHTGKKFVKDVVKGVAKSAKNQIVGEQKPVDDKPKKNIDPTTNKPVPSKKMMTQLTQATAQLQMQKLQKVREELDKIRLKVTDEKPLAGKPGAGPEMPVVKAKPQDDAVAATIRNSKSTGEMGKNTGG
jgi:hypothetical protein